MTSLFNKQVRVFYKNKCFECGINHGARVVKSSSGRYIPVDKFEIDYHVARLEKIFTLYLKVLPLDYNHKEFIFENYAPFCPHHAQQHMIDQIKSIKKSEFVKSKGIGVKNVVEVKNYFHNSFGVRPTTKEVIQIFTYFEKIFIQNTDL